MSGIWSIDMEQSFAVNPWLQMQVPLTHLPLEVQSLGHKFSTISEISGGISGFSSLLSLTYEDMFLPIISPHSFISNVTAEKANEVSPDS